MKRLEFKLSMPHTGSWEGKWSGADKNYTIVTRVTDDQAAELLKTGSWRYSWNDGWCASIDVREVPKGERVKKSDGFSGYDWMVNSILRRGYIDHTNS
jgi:hypothetical protein